MATEDLKPRSAVLREALEKGKQGDQPATSMLSVAEACKHLGISKWTLYKLMRSGRLSSVKIGSRRLIPMRAMTAYVQQLEEEGGGSAYGKQAK